MASIPQLSHEAGHTQPAAPITVLSEDEALCAAITAAAPDNVSRATRVDEAELLAATAHCAILLTDIALTPNTLGRIVRHVRTHEPAVVTVAVGTREQEAALVALMSTGSADHVMIKPVDAQLARNILTSAQREYRARKARQEAEPRTPAPHLKTADRKVSRASKVVVIHDRPLDTSTTLSSHVSEQAVTPAPGPAIAAAGTTTPAAQSRAKWWPVLVAALLSATVASLGVWWFMWRQLPTVDPAAVIATNLDAARLALTEGRHTDPLGRSAVHFYSAVLALDPDHHEAKVGIERIAALLVTRASTAIAAGQIPAAERDIERLRVIRADDNRLNRLERELQNERESIALLAAHKAATVQSVTIPAQSRLGERTPVTRADRPKPVQDPAVIERSFAAKEAPLAPVNAPLIELPNLNDIAPPELALEEEGPTQSRTLVKYVEPVYPMSARRSGIEGWVDLDVVVDSQGNVESARVRDSNKRQAFGRSAVAAVRQWRYEPRPAAKTAETVHVRVMFKLD